MGDLIIQGDEPGSEPADMTDLDLEPLKAVGFSSVAVGMLIISDTPLRNLDGLEFVASAKSIQIQGNKALTSIRGLRGIRGPLPGGIQLYYNGELLSTEGLEGITALGSFFDPWIPQSIELTECGKVESLAGFSGIRGPLRSGVTITGLRALRSLHGLEGITSIDKWNCDGPAIQIVGNERLESLDGLQGLRSLGLNRDCDAVDEEGMESPPVNAIALAWNRRLRNVSALAGLSGPIRGLSFEGNPELTSLAGLEGLSELTDATLDITRNDGLATLDALGGLVSRGNSTVHVDSNPSLVSLRGLGGLRSLDELDVRWNRGLATLAGLDNLTHVASLYIHSNNGLQTLEGLGSLQSAASAIEIESNPRLQSLAALGNVRGTTEALSVVANDQLRSLHGLEGLTEIRGFDGLTVRSNEGLESIEALGNVGYIAGSVEVRENLKLLSLSGPNWKNMVSLKDAWFAILQKMELQAGPDTCFPAGDHIPAAGPSPSSIVVQPKLQWNASRCRQCERACGRLAEFHKSPGSVVACGYGSGRCRCPLGWAGEGCAAPVATLAIAEGQAFTCNRSNSTKDSECTLLVRVCLRNPEKGPFLTRALPAAITLYDDCTGSARSAACTTGASEGVAVDFAVGADAAADPGGPAVRWTDKENNCGEVPLRLRVARGELFEPHKEAKLRLGYHPRIQPDVYLEGTLARPGGVGVTDPVYPWCLDSKACTQQAPVQISVAISGRRMHCSAGEYTVRGSGECQSCGERAYSAAGSAVAGAGGSLEALEERREVCKMCGWWHDVNDERSGCTLLWGALLGCLATVMCFALGVVSVAPHLDLTTSPGGLPWLLGRGIAIADVSADGGERWVLTSNGRHGLHARGQAHFGVHVSGTGHFRLDTSEDTRLHARVIAEDRLELVDEQGQSISGEVASSMGLMRLDPMRTLLLTGRYIPMILCAPVMLCVGCCCLCGMIFSTDYGGETFGLSVGAVALSVVCAHIQKTRQRQTPLQRRLALYGEKLHQANPYPEATERGAPRAVQLGKMIDLFDFFKDFLLDSRTMHYLDSNIIRPLTAKHKLSYAEVVRPSHVEWFVSHFWGHPFASTVRSLERHARQFAHGGSFRDVAYWVCTLSNNQYNVQQELGEGHWECSSFFLALRDRHCRGTCMVLDEKLFPLGRSWCLFELLQTLLRCEGPAQAEAADDFAGLLFCTSSGILSRGEAAMEVSLNIGTRLASLRLEDATSSVPADKVMIDSLVVSEMGGFAPINGKIRDSMSRAIEASQRAAHRDFDRVRRSLAAAARGEAPGDEAAGAELPRLLGPGAGVPGRAAGGSPKGALGMGEKMPDL